MELQEGLGLGLVSDQKPNVSVSSRSRKLRSRLHPWSVADTEAFDQCQSVAAAVFPKYAIIA